MSLDPNSSTAQVGAVFRDEATRLSELPTVEPITLGRLLVDCEASLDVLAEQFAHLADRLGPVTEMADEVAVAYDDTPRAPRPSLPPHLERLEQIHERAEVLRVQVAGLSARLRL